MGLSIVAFLSSILEVLRVGIPHCIQCTNLLNCEVGEPAFWLEHCALCTDDCVWWH